MATNEKNILLVDDEEPLLFTFQTALVAYSPDLKVYTASHGLEAIQVLDNQPIDLVVTDLKMPHMDGFQLLLHLKRFYPEIPVIVMTGIGTPEVVDWLSSLGTLRYLEKPVHIKDLAVNIFKALSAMSEGKIQGVTLSGFLQLVVMEGKSCTLRVRSKERTGILYIRNGELMDAKMRDRSGEAAANEIVTWDDAEIELGPFDGDGPRKIEGKLDEILLEAFRLKDERERGGERAEAGEEAFGTDPDLVRLEDMVGEDVPAGMEDLVRPSSPPGSGGAAPPPGGDAPGVGAARGAPHGRTKPAEPPGLREGLAGIVALPGVSAVCLVGSDGFPIDSATKGTVDADLVGAVASGGFATSRALSRDHGLGAIEGAIFEFAGGTVVVSPVGKAFLLVAVAERDAPLEAVRMKIRRLGTEIAAATESL